MGALIVMGCTFAELFIGKKNKDKEHQEKNIKSEDHKIKVAWIILQSEFIVLYIINFIFS